MTAWLSFAMWLTLMPCGCRSGGGLKRAPRGPKRAKKKCVPTTFLKTAVNLSRNANKIIYLMLRSLSSLTLFIKQTVFSTTRFKSGDCNPKDEVGISQRVKPHVQYVKWHTSPRPVWRLRISPSYRPGCDHVEIVLFHFPYKVTIICIPYTFVSFF